MKRTKVLSETILSVGYEPDKDMLELEFTGGSVYQYNKVEGYIYMGLMQAESKRVYFNEHVKEHYPCKQIAGKN